LADLSRRECLHLMLEWRCKFHANHGTPASSRSRPRVSDSRAPPLMQDHLGSRDDLTCSHQDSFAFPSDRFLLQHGVAADLPGSYFVWIPTPLPNTAIDDRCHCYLRSSTPAHHALLQHTVARCHTVATSSVSTIPRIVEPLDNRRSFKS
jgi:hypothetical protein